MLSSGLWLESPSHIVEKESTEVRITQKYEW
jgi:hypothetical protein